MPLSRRTTNAFTLVELSIVMVIIGLLIGGIVAGKSMIANQTLRKVGADATSYRIAMGQFKQQYGYLPGDFPTATSLWGRADGGTPVSANCSAPFFSGTTATCNGNGDGKIMAYDSPAYWNEMTLLWQHLANAQLIAGKYNPNANIGCNYLTDPNSPYYCYYTPVGSVNVPSGSVNNSVFVIVGSDGSQNFAWGFDNQYSGALALYAKGDPAFFGYYHDNVGVLNAQDVAQLDKKLDDGLPGSGTIRGINNTGSANCATTDVASTAQYVLTATTNACPIIFLSTFAAPLPGATN